jgi:hypothetical protein
MIVVYETVTSSVEKARFDLFPINLTKEYDGGAEMGYFYL